jgi:very-short-patch-repair endonuclease
VVTVRPQSRTAEQEIGRLGTSDHGVVTRLELLNEGVTPAEIKWRLRIGALIREYPGVYRVGHRAPNVLASYLAAVKACGEGALLSGLAAAYVYGLIKGKAPAPEVTTPTERRIRGITTRRSPATCRDQATEWRGIPVTTLPKTLVDLAPRMGGERLARLCHEAEVLHGLRPMHVEPLLDKRPSGAGKLRAVLLGDTKVLLSKLEKRFIERLKEAGLALPETNRPAGGRRVDCRWPEHKLTVELDSYTYHASRQAWEQDRRREREAHARGDEFRRYTWGDVFEHPAQMMRELKELLTVR